MVFHQATWDEPLLIELSRSGRIGYSLPQLDPSIQAKVGDCSNLIPASMLRSDPPKLPELSEPEVVRHFVRLSQMNFAIDLGMYPLGSCTMKYNPKVSQRIMRDARIANLHPYQDESTVQGTLEILHELERMLCEVTGMNRFSLAPAAGAQGEYAGALITRSFLRDRGGVNKDEMLVPDSAHGTNPSSAAMAGFKIVKVPSSSDGIVTAEQVKQALTPNTAGMMLTVPNTLGIFEREILEVTRIIHEQGGLMYYDGANMNAILGQTRPGDMGFDIVHVNVHKTFATPHGGGGPGAGPVGVKQDLEEYLPIPLISNTSGTYTLECKKPKSIGYIKSFYGNTGVLLRAYFYILSMGTDGLRAVSEQAVLSSNYLLSLLDSQLYSNQYSRDFPRKHEFVVSATPVKKSLGLSAGDIAKAILDFGMHSPTTYFPLITPEALMIEPTETEPLENLDTYARILNGVSQYLRGSEDILNIPRNTSIGRLDEYRASYPNSMVLNWNELERLKVE